jgi:hypothetical protein
MRRAFHDRRPSLAQGKQNNIARVRSCLRGKEQMAVQTWTEKTPVDGKDSRNLFQLSNADPGRRAVGASGLCP